MKEKGQSFSEFMVEQGLYEEAQELAAKKILIYQLEAEMKNQNISKNEMAKRLNTSRSAVNNILDTAYNSSIGSLEKMAYALGKRISITLQ
ncbi:helix-turn-helix domain-containing protein [Treponema putidum]|uniref:Fis family transcriptional regulator n=1 Tax=Treponema putidum TaxID=221027 RepID=A0AAE9MVQ7_9SPIR|nr:helix-turn-helix transcriptional regulator [Treponema putidum]TWI74475.1 helix-turn-helix protein [Treponema putidum]UTY29647.1 Fis family transcriptional regulator [Treponema putidum]UTY32118.1 Fis family transcriptional regulator [Treponema putidum]UTY34505.1 Fis family transcriptional regulator [Treponema putidum]